MSDLSSHYQMISGEIDWAIYNKRMQVAGAEDDGFAINFGLSLPEITAYSMLVYHQFTINISHNSPKMVQEALKNKGISSMAYYPLPLYKQKAYFAPVNLPVTESPFSTVLSLPMGADMSKEQTDYITLTTKDIIKQK